MEMVYPSFVCVFCFMLKSKGRRQQNQIIISMKQTVFRKVSVKDRLPKEEGIYLVNNGLGWFEAFYDEQFSFHMEFTDCSGVEYWMEEVYLPSEEEIKKIDSWNAGESRTFIGGANYILNLLK